MDDPQSKSCCHHKEKKPAWYVNKTFLAAVGLLGVSGLSFVIPLLVPFRQSLLMYAQAVWWAILLGLTIGGAMHHYVPQEMVSHVLAKPRKRTILYSVILGFFMSVCSHGILALSIQLHKKGASNPAVIAFLLASPWANFPLTIMLIGFLLVIVAQVLCMAFLSLAEATISRTLLDKVPAR